MIRIKKREGLCILAATLCIILVKLLASFSSYYYYYFTWRFMQRKEEENAHKYLQVEIGSVRVPQIIYEENEGNSKPHKVLHDRPGTNPGGMQMGLTI